MIHVVHVVFALFVMIHVMIHVGLFVLHDVAHARYYTFLSETAYRQKKTQVEIVEESEVTTAPPTNTNRRFLQATENKKLAVDFELAAEAEEGQIAAMEVIERMLFLVQKKDNTRQAAMKKSCALRFSYIENT